MILLLESQQKKLCFTRGNCKCARAGYNYAKKIGETTMKHHGTRESKKQIAIVAIIASLQCDIGSILITNHQDRSNTNKPNPTQNGQKRHAQGKPRNSSGQSCGSSFPTSNKDPHHKNGAGPTPTPTIQPTNHDLHPCNTGAHDHLKSMQNSKASN